MSNYETISRAYSTQAYDPPWADKGLILYS